MTRVTLVNLSKRYGEHHAVRNLNMEAEAGELVALLGPSGCGKTTTLRMIAGLLPPTRGDVLFDDRSVLNTPAERRGAVMVFQNGLLFPHMTVAENVAFGLRMRGVKRSEIKRRVAEMLDMVQLPDLGARRVQALSGGQQQRVALARALVIRPQVLLLDEPLASLDANLRLEMRRLIRSIQQELGITTIFVTHDQEEAVMLADRVALLMDGALQQYDDARTLYARPASAAVARFFRNENWLPGVKNGACISTAVGDFGVEETLTQPDGPVLLTVRPEDVAVVPRSGGKPAQNWLETQVLDVIYMGAHTQVEVIVGERRWLAHLPADTCIRPGATVYLHLPQARIWLLPAA